MKKIFFLIIVLIFLSSCSSAKYQFSTKFNNALECFSKPIISNTQTTVESNKTEDNQEDKNQIKDTVKFDMVFTSQAPYANWDELHEEACEEASLLIVHYYLQNKSSLTKEEAENIIQDMVAWQIKNYGGHYDLTLDQLADFAKRYYGYKNIQIKNVKNIDEMKIELSNGNPIIIPAAGRDLGNPYFKSPGPIYHMLVVKGYNSRYFITNDVGTRRGENFQYKFDKLFDAIHDYNGKTEEKMRQGVKRILIISN